MRLSALALFVVTACHPGILIDEATSPSIDPECLGALEHVRRCDARFGDRTELCRHTSNGEGPPYVNAQQERCLREASCESVRATLDRRDWLCGLEASP